MAGAHCAPPRAVGLAPAPRGVLNPIHHSTTRRRSPFFMTRFPLAALLAAFFLALAWFVSLRQAVLFLVGIGMGAVLAGARFGFTTGWRRLIEQRDPSGVMAQLLLLALAAAMSMPLLAMFPTDLGAALGPPSVSLLIGAFVFGAAMQVADGC